MISSMVGLGPGGQVAMHELLRTILPTEVVTVSMYVTPIVSS